jgi:hypothetical protein
MLLDMMLTAQEHKLVGSTAYDKRYLVEPYKPFAVIDGLISVEDCDAERQKTGELLVIADHWNVDALVGYASLEPLELDKKSTNYGFTIKDPVLLRWRKEPYLLEECYVDNFPYARGKPQINLENML